jgi:hypothetical protein
VPGEQESVLLVGKRSGAIEKWDTRTASPLPALSASGGGSPLSGDNIMDLEVNYRHGVFLVATGTKVCSYEVAGLRLVKEFDMPAPMTFKEEGGVSLSPDGTKFIAVRIFSFLLLLLLLPLLLPHLLPLLPPTIFL